MTSPGIVPHQDHQAYRRDIDELFSITSGALARLTTIIQQRKGKQFPNGEFFPFYEGFQDLFLQTSKSAIMQSEEDLINKIDEWLDFTKPIDVDRVKEGRDLFRKWGNAMERQGLHTFTK